MYFALSERVKNHYVNVASYLSGNAEHHNPVTIISDTILERTQIVQLTDKDYDLLPSSTRIIAEEQVLQLIDRFRKLVR